MTENNNSIPQLNPSKIPEFLQGDKWFNEEIDGDFLDFEEPYRPPRYTMERKGIPFADVGELHIISGKPGNGKTGLMSQLMAAVLNGRHGNTIRREVPHKVIGEDGEVSEKIIPIVVLYIDTEQGKDDTVAIKNRVCAMAGIDFTKPSKQFYILRLRDTEEASERWRKILKAIWVIRPTDIFLDGLLDIVKDYNDQVECQPVIRKCMMLATHYDSSMWAVLHENPMVDKLVGVLGSITQRKVSEIFTVLKIKQSELKESDRRPDLPDIYFRVKQVKARGRDVDDWLFKYVTNAGGWGQPVELDDNGATAMSQDAKVVKESIERFKDLAWTTGGLSYNDLDRHLTNQGVSSGATKSNIINAALECQVLTSSGNKGHRKFFYNGDRPLRDSNELPFDKPDDKELPF